MLRHRQNPMQSKQLEMILIRELFEKLPGNFREGPIDVKRFFLVERYSRIIRHMLELREPRFEHESHS